MKSPRTGVAGGCELLDVGSGNQSEFAFHCSASSPAHHLFSLWWQHLELWTSSLSGFVFWSHDVPQGGKKKEISLAVAIVISSSFHHCVWPVSHCPLRKWKSFVFKCCQCWKHANVCHWAEPDESDWSPCPLPYVAPLAPAWMEGIVVLPLEINIFCLRN